MIELLAVILIILIITTLLMSNYRTGRHQLALDRSAHKLAQDIRRVQEMAMSSREYFACGVGFQGSFGIHLRRHNNHNHYYVLFANCDNDSQYSGADINIAREEYEPGVIFNKVQHRAGAAWVPPDPGLGPGHITIIFFPPDPERIVDCGDPLDCDVRKEHRLRLSVNGRFKCLYVNRAGLIYVKECS